MQSTVRSSINPNLVLSRTLMVRKAGYAAVLFAASAIFSSSANADGDPSELLEEDGGVVLDASGNTVETAQLETTDQDTQSTAGERAKEILNDVKTALTPESAVPSLVNARVSGYVSDKAFSLQYERSTIEYGVEQGRVDAGFLFTEERDLLFQAGFAIDAPTLASSFRFSFGSRAYIALLGDENNDAFALALGVEAAYNLPFERLPLELHASAYYAPDITTFGQGERFIDANVDVILPVRQQFDVFAGFRFLRVDMRPGDTDLDDQIHAGLRYSFE